MGLRHRTQVTQESSQEDAKQCIKRPCNTWELPHFPQPFPLSHQGGNRYGQLGMEETGKSQVWPVPVQLPLMENEVLRCATNTHTHTHTFRVTHALVGVRCSPWRHNSVCGIVPVRAGRCVRGGRDQPRDLPGHPRRRQQESKGPGLLYSETA